MFFDSDICWCGNSNICKQTDCFRHLSNKNGEEKIFTCANLMWTEICPYFGNAEMDEVDYDEF